jgi:hypothetical protein
MIRLFSLMLLVGSGLLRAGSCTAAISHELFLDDAKQIQKIVAPGSTPIEFFCDPNEYSETLALVALRMHEIHVASVSLRQLRSAMPELKFVTHAMDETDIAILKYSLASLGFTLLKVGREKRHIYLLISNYTPDTEAYRKITEVLNPT